MHILYLRSVDENKQAPHQSQRPGYLEAKEQLRNLQKGDKRTLWQIWRQQSWQDDNWSEQW